MKMLASLYMPKLESAYERHSRACQLIGPVGTGKTACAVSFGRLMEEAALKRMVKLKHVYLNCKVDGASRYRLYRNLLDKAAPEVSTQGLSPEEMLHQFLKYLESEDMFLLITVDEIGHFYKLSKERVIYDLTRLDEAYMEKSCRVFGAIFIDRDTGFHKMLDESELSTLGRFPIRFQKYSENQIFDILIHRASEALKPAAFSEELIRFISEIVAKPPINGDMRVALDLLLYSGNLAQNLGETQIKPDHVRRVQSETHPTITTQDILDLNMHGKLMLLAIVRNLEDKHSPYVSLPEIRDTYAVICEEKKLKPQENVEEIIDDLLSRQIIEMKSLMRITISDVPAEKLRRYLNGIMERVMHGLGEA